MRTKPEQHSWSLWAVLLMSWLCGLPGASLLAQPGGDTGGGTGGTNGVPEAPIDGLYYARLNAAWQDFAPGLYSMQTDAPDDGGYYARHADAWSRIQTTVTGGTLDVLVAAAAEFQSDGVDGTVIPRNSSRFIALNHLYDPDGLVTALNQSNRTFRVQTGRYAVTVVVPMVPSGTSPGNNRIPYTISLWDVSAATNIYYSSYTLYDDDRTQVTSVFLPIFDAAGDKDYAIRVQNLDADQDLLAGLDNEVPGLDNHYTELSLMKLSGAVSLPATEWAVDNLLVNLALETGQVGQAIGYTAAGEVGVVDLGAGGGSGTDTNAVHGYYDSSELPNNAQLSQKALAGTNIFNFQSVRIGDPTTTNQLAIWNTNNWNFVELCGAPVLGNQSINQLIIDTHSPSDCTIQLYLTNARPVLGSRYQLTARVKSTFFSASWTFVPGIDQSLVEWLSANETVGTDFMNLAYNFTALSTNGFGLAANNGVGAFIGLMIQDLQFVEIERYNLWQNIGSIYPDAPADGQTYGRQDGAWVVVTGGGGLTSKTVDIPAVNYQFVPDTDVIVINSTTPFTTGDYVFTGEPIILPGVDGQYLTITNLSNADLQFTRGMSFGIYCASSLFTIASDIKFDQNYVGYFRFNGPTGQWDAIGGWPIVSLLEVTALPAPWEPPDADGNQVIRDSVQDALIDALLPRLLQRIGPSAGTMPAPAPAPRRLGAPGTRGNPIDWPAAAAADDTGKYSININIRDQ